MDRRTFIPGLLATAAATALPATAVAAVGSAAPVAGAPAGLLITRISANRASPHYHPSLQDVHVYVDGREIHSVMEADASEGWVDSFCLRRVPGTHHFYSAPILNTDVGIDAPGFVTRRWTGRVTMQLCGSDPVTGTGCRIPSVLHQRCL